MNKTIAIPKDELIKTSIIDAAKDLFQQFGLSKTTMEDIARSIGKAKSSLYYYFATKEDIFEAVVLKEKQNIFSEVEGAIKQAQTAEEKLKAFALTIHSELKNKRVLLLNIIKKDISADLCLESMFRQRYDEIELNLIRDIITYGIERGEFKRQYLKNLNAISLLSISTLRGLHLDKTNRNTLSLINLSVDLLVKALKND